jgi:SAM-dependent methyltransferase
MEDLIRPLVDGEADAVFGTRMAQGGRALAGGMPLYKYVGNRILTFIQNRLLGTRLSEFHSGYRAYSVKALASLPFQFNTNDFHFDTEIIIQLLLRGCRIREVPIPTYYGDEICRVKGIPYAWNVVRTTVGVKLHGMHIFYRRRFDVMGAMREYPLKLGYLSSHTMALAEVKPDSRVLDVGCGRGYLGRELEKSGCYVQGVDEACFEGECLLRHFAKMDLNGHEVPFAPDDFDFVLLLDVLEHLDAQEQYRLLDDLRARSRRRKPVLLITVPNVAFFIIRLQLLLGRFNYGKRGILDQTHRHLFTFGSLRELLMQSGYQIEKVSGIPAPFPAAIGDSRLARMLLAINRALIFLAPRLFAYQVFVRARPVSTAEQLLSDAEQKSGERHETIRKQTPAG